MKTMTLASDDAIPAFGLGTWKSAPGEVAAAVQEAVTLGYRHIDCAHIYGNEAEIGTAFAQLGVPRKELWITSKLWNNAHAPENVLPALEITLEHLQLEYLDLYLIHWPAASQGKYVDSFGGLIQSRGEGQARSIGVSNFTEEHLSTVIDRNGDAPSPTTVNLQANVGLGDLIVKEK